MLTAGVEREQPAQVSLGPEAGADAQVLGVRKLCSHGPPGSPSSGGANSPSGAVFVHEAGPRRLLALYDWYQIVQKYNPGQL